MNKIIDDAAFYVFAATLILPAPTLLYAWMTGKTFTQILFR